MPSYLQQNVLREIADILGTDAVLSRPEELMVYDCDAYTLAKSAPTLVTLPETTEQVSRIVRIANREGLPVIPRGAGTGISGGTFASRGGIVIGLSRMTRILDVDVRNRRIRAQAGAINYQLTKAAATGGCFFAPDPSSQGVSTIGGNVAENAGGPHTLRYGVTVNHITGLELVLPDGEMVTAGGYDDEPFGYDIVGVLNGSEGTFGIVTEVTARLMRRPQAWRTLLAIFDTIDDATRTVSSIIAARIVPAALEMMDRLAVEAVEAAFSYGFPLDAEAVLLIELEGLEMGIDRTAADIEAICREHRAREVRRAADDLSRAQLWAARKKAVGALGRLAPSIATQDGVIPRDRLPEVLREAYAIVERHGLRVANLFHAGDGNLHPIILFDDSIPEECGRVVEAGEEILALCLRAGGSLTGEHGIGVEKCRLMSTMFDTNDLRAMRLLKDAFNPEDTCNPDKIFPDSRYCLETRVRPSAASI